MQGKDSCNGDSGGPLICNDKAIGIVSYGDTNCGLYPAVYTKLNPFRKWIESHEKVLGKEADDNGTLMEMLFYIVAIYVLAMGVFVIFCWKTKDFLWSKFGTILGWNPLPTTEADEVLAQN